MRRNLAQVLAFLGAADCVFVPLLFALQLQQPFFPQPGLYFIEISTLGLLGWISIIRSRWYFISWLIAGVMVVFNILGAWTIGLFLIPATICFLGAGFLIAERGSVSIGHGLRWFVTGILFQSVFMMAWIYFSR